MGSTLEQGLLWVWSMNAPTILFCDDEPKVVSALARLARKEGLSFIADTSSQQVLDMAKTCHPDVIVIDINQPIDGRDLLASLKKDERTKDIKVVMLSGTDDQFTRNLCFELGAEDYVVKPVDPTFVKKLARMAVVNAA